MKSAQVFPFRSPSTIIEVGMKKVHDSTVKVSEQTARKLSSLQRSLKTKNLDETVDILLLLHRNELLKQAFGADRGKIKPFGEEDRGEGCD